MPIHQCGAWNWQGFCERPGCHVPRMMTWPSEAHVLPRCALCCRCWADGSLSVQTFPWRERWAGAVGLPKKTCSWGRPLLARSCRSSAAHIDGLERGYHERPESLWVAFDYSQANRGRMDLSKAPTRSVAGPCRTQRNGRRLPVWMSGQNANRCANFVSVGARILGLFRLK
jgi:hypothetical protein